MKLKLMAKTLALATLIATPLAAQQIVIPQSEATAAEASAIRTVDVVNDDVIVSVLEGADLMAYNVGGAEAAIRYLCEDGGEHSLPIKMEDEPWLLLWLENDHLMVAAAEDVNVSGSASTQVDCPLPEAVTPFAEDVRGQWTMHRGHGTSEFTDEDLRTVLAYMRDKPMGEIINMLDIPKGAWGNDVPYIRKAVEVGNSPTGQLVGWQVKGEKVTYYIVADTCLEVCSGRAVVWHLHTASRVSAPTPRVSTPVVETAQCVEMPWIRMREPANIEIRENSRNGRLITTIDAGAVNWVSSQVAGDGNRKGSYVKPCIDPTLIRGRVICLVSPWAAKRLGSDKVSAVVNGRVPNGARTDLTL